MSSAAENALIEQGDRWLRHAAPDPTDPEAVIDDAAATLACAYFLRAGIVARQDAQQRARADGEAMQAAIRQRREQQQQKEPDVPSND
jgi:hypothetical protein